MTKEEAMKVWDLIPRPINPPYLWEADYSEYGTIDSIAEDLDIKSANLGYLVEYSRAIEIDPVYVVVTRVPNLECDCSEFCECDEYGYEEFSSFEEARERVRSLGVGS